MIEKKNYRQSIDRQAEWLRSVPTWLTLEEAVRLIVRLGPNGDKYVRYVRRPAWLDSPLWGFDWLSAAGAVSKPRPIKPLAGDRARGLAFFRARELLACLLSQGAIRGEGRSEGSRQRSQITEAEWGTRRLDGGRLLPGHPIFEKPIVDIVIRRDDLLAEIKKTQVSKEEKKKTWPSPPAYNWELIKQETFRLMEYHGDFTPEDPDWNARARLEEKLQEYCSKAFGGEPALSSLREKIKPWLREWREGKRRA